MYLCVVLVQEGQPENVLMWGWNSVAFFCNLLYQYCCCILSRCFALMRNHEYTLNVLLILLDTEAFMEISYGIQEGLNYTHNICSYSQHTRNHRIFFILFHQNLKTYLHIHLGIIGSFTISRWLRNVLGTPYLPKNVGMKCWLLGPHLPTYFCTCITTFNFKKV